MLIVVTGPPAGGKTTWVRAHAKARDIVIDYDIIAQSIAGPGAGTHDHSDASRAIAHRMRYAAIDEAVRHIADTDVYLIHTQPNEKDRAKYKRLGARVVEVDPGKAVVLERVRQQRKPNLAGVVSRWYSQRSKAQPTHRVSSQASRRW